MGILTKHSEKGSGQVRMTVIIISTRHIKVCNFVMHIIMYLQKRQMAMPLYRQSCLRRGYMT